MTFDLEVSSNWILKAPIYSLTESECFFSRDPLNFLEISSKMKDFLLSDATVDHFVTRYVAIIKNITDNGKAKNTIFQAIHLSIKE
jgi:hypothetical protein